MNCTSHLVPTAVPLVSSPLFPLLCLSLQLFQKHSPKTTESFFSEYDYIIVGAGSAGATLAGRLSEIPCVRILLLEAGKKPPILTEIPTVNYAYRGSDISWDYLTAPQKHAARLAEDRRLDCSVAKVVGGSSVHNGLVYVRGHRHIYDKWHDQGATGWSYLDVLPYFKKMEKNRNPESIDIPYHGFHGLLSIEDSVFIPEYRSALNSAMHELGYDNVDANGHIQNGFYEYQSTMKKGRRCSTAKAYLVPAENRKNLHIVANAFVTKVLLINKRASGVQFMFKEKLYEVKATREVIISAGAFNTPKILMLSGVGPKKHLENIGISVIADLPVGLNFHDHVGSIHYYTVDNAPFPYSVPSKHDFMEYIYKGIGPLASRNFEILFTSAQKSSSILAVPDLEIYFFFSPGVIFADDINQNVRDHVLGPYQNKTMLTCIPTIIQPRSRGYVSIRSADAYENPIINPNHLAHSDDVDNLAEGLIICDKVANASAMQFLGVKPIAEKYPGCEDYPRYSKEFARCVVESISLSGRHPVSSAKMGDIHDPTTVVDPQLRVKGLKGLRVVDASVMPIIPSGNTNTATIMVAEKAADIIKSTIQCNEEFMSYNYKPF